MKLNFSLLSLVLLIATVALALRVFQLTIINRKFESNNSRLSLSVGDFDAVDTQKIYIRQLDCTIPMAWQFLVQVPSSSFRLRCIARTESDDDGGPLHESSCRLVPPSGKFMLTIYMNVSPEGGVSYRANCVHDQGGVVTGGLIDTKLDMDQMRIAHDPHGLAVSHRIENGRPHGDLVILGGKDLHQLLSLQNTKGESIEMWFEPDDQ